MYFIQQVDYTTNFHEIHAKCRARQTPRVGGRPRAVGRGLHVDTACTIVVSERRYLLSPVRLSVCLSVVHLSVVYNVRAPYSGGSNFRQYFYGVRYLGHPLTSAEKFTEIVPGEPSVGGVKRKRGSQI